MAGVFESLSNLISSIFSTIISFFQSIFAVFQSVIGSVVDIATGVFNFVLQNIVAIGILAAVVVGFSAYQQRHGQTITGKKRA